MCFLPSLDLVAKLVSEGFLFSTLHVAHLIEKWNYFSTFAVNFYILSQVQLLGVFFKYLKYHNIHSLITLA
jgi:hypothetical protein